MSLLSTLLGTPEPDEAPRLSEKAEHKRVQKLISESSGYLTLGPAEVRVLKGLLRERSGDNPFTQSQFTVKDASLLGLEIDPNDDAGSNQSTTQELTNQSQMDYEAGMLPAHLALVAPDLTPGHSSPVSTSEAQRVIGPQEPRAAAPTAPPSPQQAPVSTAESRAAAMLGLDVSHTSQPLHEDTPRTEPGDVNRLAANLAESRRRRNQTKTHATHANRAHNSEEGRKLASTAAAKLSAL